MKDSLWFESEASLDSALFYLQELFSRDSLDPEIYPILELYRDSIYSLMVECSAVTSQLHFKVPFSAYWDIQMEEVTDSQIVELDSITATLLLSEYSLPVITPLHHRIIQAMAVLTGGGRVYFSKWLNRRSRYQKIIFDELQHNGLPEDLIYLAMVESGFNPKAWSRASASGIWQFISATGGRFGLSYNWWVDERRDPEKATKAAAAYLKQLHGMFGDWHLAMAAYNCGEGRIGRLLRAGEGPGYWDMQLPSETMNYVPKILAAMIIGHNPQKYNFEITPEPLLVYDTVTVFHCLSLDIIAIACNSTVEDVKLLNPELRRWCTPPDVKSYVLRLPQGSRAIFQNNYQALDKKKLVNWHRHIVSSGETLGHLSQKYGVPIQAIKTTNNIRGNLIKINQAIIIPVPAISVAGVTNLKIPLNNKVIRNKNNLSYTIKTGDNLYDIAKSFGVSLAALMQINGMSKGTIIKPGQTIKISSNEDTSEPVHQASKFNIYRVRAGDNLSVISKKLNITTDDLKKWNNLASSKIKIGQQLQYISKVKSNDSEGFYYIIKPQDTLWDLSKRFKTTVSAIKKLNNNLSGALKPGMKIRIK